MINVVSVFKLGGDYGNAGSAPRPALRAPAKPAVRANTKRPALQVSAARKEPKAKPPAADDWEEF
jgi:hypothetical protein